MKHLFVPYEIALKLKDIGFDEPCFAEYRQWDGGMLYLVIYQDDDDESDQDFTTESIAPLYQQVVDFFDKKKVQVNIINTMDTVHPFTYTIYNSIDPKHAFSITTSGIQNRFETRNEAFDKAFDCAIAYFENKQIADI